MKKPLKKINIAGRWTMSIDLDLHGGSMTDIGGYLLEVQEAIEKAAKTVANRQDLNVNLKGAKAYVETAAVQEVPS